MGREAGGGARVERPDSRQDQQLHTPTITTEHTGRPVGGGGEGGIHQPHFTPSPWRDHAACANHEDPEIFFPTDANLPNIARAQAVCARCEVKTECLMWAFENNIHDGIWGGLTEQERFLMLGLNRRRDRRAKLNKRKTS